MVASIKESDSVIYRSPEGAQPPDSTARELALFERLMRWCLRNAQSQARQGQLDHALAWARWAALLFCDQRCGVLTCPPLERTLARIARCFPTPTPLPRPQGPRRWLHVFTHWENTGGHANLALRWIEAEPDDDVHSIVLIEQQAELPPQVAAATAARGGQLYRLPPELSNSQRVERLRQLAWCYYDVVALHLHPFDVVSATAFAIPGGPPVVLVNAADHMFWAGASVADLAIHIRPLAQQWAERYRGLPRGCVLPIPLPEPEAITDTQRVEARRQLGLPADACVLLSIGSDWKFAPLPGINFMLLAGQILSSCPTAHMLVVGPDPHSPRWRHAIEHGGGRLTIHGATPNLQPFHQAADIYLDPMPHGSLTALLEVAMRGVPCLLQPRSCTYPLYPEDGSLAVTPRPLDFEDYLRRVRQLVSDPVARRRQGALLAESVCSHHCGKGWQGRLGLVKSLLPSAHRVWPVRPEEPMPESYIQFWHQFQGPLEIDEFLRYAIGYPVRTGIGLGLNRDLWKAIMGECARLHPVNGLYVLEHLVNLGGPQLRETSLYVDFGNGLSEANRLKKKTILGGEGFRISFDLSQYPSVRSLRWDPIEDIYCKVRLDSVSYVSNSGEKCDLDLNRIGSNGTRLPDGVYAFPTPDSMFFLPIAGQVSKITLKGQWWANLTEAEIQAATGSAPGSDAPAASKRSKMSFRRIIRKTRPAALLKYARGLLKRQVGPR